MRLVIELKKDVFPQVVINQLYRLTDLQTTFGVINLSIVDGRPAVLNLKETLARLRRAPPRRRHAPHALRAPPGRGAARDRRRPRHGDHRGRPRHQDDPRSRATPTTRAPPCMTLPLQGPRGVRAPRRPPRGGDRRGRRAQATTSSPSARPRPSSRCASRASPASSSEKLADGVRRALRRDRAPPRHPRRHETLLDERHRRWSSRRSSAKYADKRRTEIVADRGRDHRRGPDPGRGHGRHDLARRLHQAHAAVDVPRAEARRQGQDRHGGARRGLGHPALRRVDALVRLLLHRQGQGLREEGLRDPARARAPRRAARSSTSSAWSRARRSPPSSRSRRSKTGTFVVTLTRRGQIKKTEVTEYENFREKGIIGVKIEEGDQLLARRAHRRHARVPHRHQARAVDPLPRGPGAPDGPRARSA